MGKRYTVSFNAKIVPVKPINDEFTLCKCYVMHLGKNRNFSYISRDAADKAEPTIFNIPVVGHLYEDDEGNYHMGGHDAELAVDGDGEYVFKSLCVPYGVVPESANLRYEDMLDSYGDVQTYLVCDLILWTGRYPELMDAIYDEKTYFGQSMEINVFDKKPLQEDKNYTELTDYSYSAFCLLGKSDNPEEHVEPCFPLASVSPYEYSVDEQFYEKMEAMKKELKNVFEANDQRREEGTMDESCKTPETEVETAEATECAAEPNVEPSQEQPEQNGDDYASEPEQNNEGENGDGAFDAQPAEPAENDEPKSAKFTYGEKRDAIISALQDRESGNVFYWLCDFDDEYAFVERVTIDENGNGNENYGRFKYGYNEDDKTAAVDGEFEEMYPKWLTKEELDVLEAMRVDYAALLDYKAKREDEDRKAEYDAVIAEFSDVSASEEFAHILADKYSYKSSDELKKECYAVRGMLSAPSARHKQSTEPVIPVSANTRVKSAQEEFFSVYGK